MDNHKVKTTPIQLVLWIVLLASTLFRWVSNCLMLKVFVVLLLCVWGLDTVLKPCQKALVICVVVYPSKDFCVSMSWVWETDNLGVLIFTVVFEPEFSYGLELRKAVRGLAAPLSIPPWWNMCIPNRFTVPRGSLVACMFPRELKWEEVAPPHKGMIQLKVPTLVSYKLHVKGLW